MEEPELSVYSGGDGSSYENAVVVNAASSSDRVAAEFEYISNIYGQSDSDWSMVKQTFCMRDDKYYDVLTIRPADGDEKSIFFDITAFFGKQV